MSTTEKNSNRFDKAKKPNNKVSAEDAKAAAAGAPLQSGQTKKSGRKTFDDVEKFGNPINTKLRISNETRIRDDIHEKKFQSIKHALDEMVSFWYAHHE